MGADRLLTAAAKRAEAAPAAGPDVAAERKRVMAAITMVVDDSLRALESVTGHDPEELVKAFATELVTLMRFVRKGETLEEFAAARQRATEGTGDDKDKAGG